LFWRFVFVPRVTFGLLRLQAVLVALQVVLGLELLFSWMLFCLLDVPVLIGLQLVW
jgi:hypothetical protein